MKYSIVTYTHHAVYWISRTYSSCITETSYHVTNLSTVGNWSAWHWRMWLSPAWESPQEGSGGQEPDPQTSFPVGIRPRKMHPDSFGLLLLKLPCSGLKQYMFIAYLQGNSQSLYEFSQGQSVISSPPFPSAFVIFVSLTVPKM